ncbi:MAG: hypothetical protein RLW62_02070 [Gammaproteobacteria bacterium]
MTAGSPGSEDMPDVQVLMAAVIRLMSRCLANPGGAETRTLVQLIARLREHPHLRREPAVLAALAESHFAWLERRSAEVPARADEMPPCARGERKLH